MFELYNLLNTDRVLCHASISSKKRALQTLADALTKDNPELKTRKVFDQLCDRERLGSTGLGDGIAVPHCRMDGLDEPIAALITTDIPISFDAPDGKPLDLLVGLIVPSEATDIHLQLLANIAKRFSEKDMCTSIRQATTPEEVLNLLRPTTLLE